MCVCIREHSNAITAGKLHVPNQSDEYLSHSHVDGGPPSLVKAMGSYVHKQNIRGLHCQHNDSNSCHRTACCLYETSPCVNSYMQEVVRWQRLSRVVPQGCGSGWGWMGTRETLRGHVRVSWSHHSSMHQSPFLGLNLHLKMVWANLFIFILCRYFPFRNGIESKGSIDLESIFSIIITHAGDF